MPRKRYVAEDTQVRVVQLNTRFHPQNGLFKQKKKQNLILIKLKNKFVTLKHTREG
jgi:hypothetical protein